MNSAQIFGLQFALNLIVCALIARWYIAPRLAALPIHAALIPLLLFHTLRTVGMVFVVPAVVDPNLPRDFAVPAAYGDLLAVLLAFAAIARCRPACAARWRWYGSSTSRGRSISCTRSTRVCGSA
jgi:hypothetical protein